MRIASMLLALAACVAPLLAPRGAIAQSEITALDIDRLLRTEWKKRNVVPAAPVDDARYLRRISLDITGTLPTPEEIKAFLANKSPNKRAEAVNALLASPRYAERWTNYWDDVLMGKQVRMQIVDRGAFRQWLYGRFKSNAPYDKFVYDLLTATGVNSAGGARYALAAGMMMPQEAMEMQSADSGTGDKDNRINGAVNWHLKYLQTPADLSGTVSRVFLGVQIQCAQCHDHKTEKWKQEDFRRLTSCFMQTRTLPIDRDPQLRGIRRIEVSDFARSLRVPPRFAQKARENGRAEYMAATPAALDGTDFSGDINRRQSLAKWMIAKENPWFAQAIVNRMWAHFLGRGFVDPIDDFREGNPPVAPQLLKRLSEDFAENGYDLKRLIRTICATQAYQVGSTPAKQNDSGNTLWARYRLKPPAPEILVEMLVSATKMEDVLRRTAGERLPALRFAMRRQFEFLFDVDEETERKEFEGTIPQALLLLNGSMVNNGSSLIPGAALAETMALSGGDAEKIENLYLRTVSRPPTAKELARWTQFVNASRDVTSSPTVALPSEPDSGSRRRRPMAQTPKEAGQRQTRTLGGDPFARTQGLARNGSPKTQAFEDLFWALLNSSEFLFNH